MALEAGNETYQKYLSALGFRPDDFVCVSTGGQNGDVKLPWRNYFQSFSALSTPASEQKLATRNENGENLYISMAPFLPDTKDRKKEFVAGVRHAWVDADENGEAILARIVQEVNEKILPEPALGIETSIGRFQIVWRLDPADFDVPRQELLNRMLQTRFGTDPAVTDTARVLRIAGFKNNKYDSKPLTKILCVGPAADHKFADFKIELPTQTIKTPATVTGDTIPYGQHDKELTRIGGRLRHDGMEENMIAAALSEVCERRCENYGPDYQEMCSKIAHSVCRYSVGKDDTVLVGGKVAGSEPVKQVSAPSQPQVEEVQALVSVDGDAFMQEIIAPRKTLLQLVDKKHPIFTEQSINQIYAWRGIGKTCVGYGLTAAFANGATLLNWEAPQRARVLYVEGELPAAQAQERWKQIVGATNGYARLITIDKQPGHIIPSLATAIGMARVEKTLVDLETQGFKVQVLVLDSISTLFNITANDEEAWITIQAWLISLRSRGLCIFFFHHAGKSGLSRSHSKSEDMLDVSIKLDEPKDRDSNCLHAVIHYDKARAGFSESDYEIKMHRAHSEKCPCIANPRLIGCLGDSVRWEHIAQGENKRFEAERRFASGMSDSDIATELDIVPSTVRSWRKKWKTKADKLKGIAVAS